MYNSQRDKHKKNTQKKTTSQQTTFGCNGTRRQNEDNHKLVSENHPSKTIFRKSLKIKQNFQLLLLKNINKKNPKIYKTRKRRNTKLRALKNTGAKLQIALKSRIGCSKLGTITTKYLCLKFRQTQFFKHYHSGLKKQ